MIKIEISVMLWRWKSVNIQIKRNTRSWTGEGKFWNFIWTGFDMVLFGFRYWYYGCGFLQVRDLQTNKVLIGRHFHGPQAFSDSLCIPGTSFMRLNKKKEEPSRSSSLLLDGSEEFDLNSEKIWIAIWKINLIRRCFQTVFILYINKPTILQSFKLRIIEGKLKDAARKLSKGSVTSSTLTTRISLTRKLEPVFWNSWVFPTVSCTVK